jgi:hypothetical protein
LRRSHPQRSRWLSTPVLAACVVLTTCRLHADEPALSSADTVDLTAAINRAIADKLAAAEITPAPAVDDERFLRRVTLDLAGRIPTPSEQAAFRADQSPDRRARLVDRLLASSDFAFHQRNEINRHLMGSRSTADPWNTYLLTAAREARPWDRLFREIMLPERDTTIDAAAGEFMRQRNQGLDSLTNDVAALWFGVNVSCAKCHDHPLVADWKQDHYFGLASFFQRTYPTQRGLVAEKFEGRLKFTTVDGEEKQAAFLFLSGAAVDEPPLAWTDDVRKTTEEAVAKAEKEAEASPPPLPEFSPRAELVRLAVEQGADGFLPRSYVNRVWARLIGRGLVHPLDQMHSGNPPSHPELLTTLAHDCVERGYDARRLIRAIILSEVYARDSHWGDGERPAPELFAVAVVRPFTPRQLALSLDVATLAPTQLAPATTGDGWSTQREQLETHSVGIASRLELPEDGFQVSVDEALLFSNGTAMADEYLRVADDRLVGSLAVTSDVNEIVNAAFTSTLCRSPGDDERSAVVAYLEQRSDRQSDGLRQVVWALLASPEFRFNH